MEAIFPWQINSPYVIIISIVVRSLSFLSHWSKIILNYVTKFGLMASLSILIHIKLFSLIFYSSLQIHESLYITAFKLKELEKRGLFFSYHIV